jgi:predicted nucleotidyltransferase
MFGLSDNVIKDLCAIFRKYPNIDEALIFGSRAKGTYRNGSDIDLALKGENITYNQILDLYIHIDDLGLLYKVDLLPYSDKIGTPIGDHIDRVGEVFYSKETKINIEVDVLE